MVIPSVGVVGDAGSRCGGSGIAHRLCCGGDGVVRWSLGGGLLLLLLCWSMLVSVLYVSVM